MYLNFSASSPARVSVLNPIVDLGLAGRADLVVGALDLNAGGDHRCGHLVPQVREVVHRRNREVTALVPRLVAPVAALFDATGIPCALDGVDVVVALVLRGLEPHVVEDVELGFRAEVNGVGDTGGLQIGLRLGGHLARIALVGLAGARLDDREVHVERLGGAERVEEGRRRVRDELHVGLMDFGETAYRRAVEHDAFGEEVLGQSGGGHVEMLLLAGEVREAHVDELDGLVLDEAQDLFGTGEHPSSGTR